MSRVVDRTVGGLRRVVTAPGLGLGAWVGLVGLAGLVGLHVEAVVAAALGPFDALDRERVLFEVASVLRLHPAASVGLAMAVLGGALTSGVAWLLLSPVVIGRLAGHRTLRALGERALAGLPGVVAQSLWHVLLRGVLLVAVVLAVRPLPVVVVRWSAVVLVWLVASVALDATRVAVVEHGAGPWHPRTAWRGFARVLRRPSVLVPGVGLGLAQLAVSGAIAWIALSGLGGGSAWVPRLLALLGVGLGLWRIAVVVDDAASDEG